MKLIWDVTWKCNLRCKHCAAFDEISIAAQESSLLEKIDIIDNACNRYGLTGIHFLGGEPFLSPDFLQIFEYCQYRNLHVSIVTNGTLLNTEMIQKFLSKVVMPTELFFSIDGPNASTNDSIRGKGTYDKCIESIVELQKIAQRQDKFELLTIAIGATINKPNLEQLADYVDLCNRLKVNLNLANIAMMGNAMKHMDFLKIEDRIQFQSALESLCQRYAESNSDFRLHWDVPPKRTYFLNRMYGVNFIPKKFSCSVLNKTLRIDHKGSVEKCMYMQNCGEFSAETLSSDFIIGNQGFSEFPLKNLKKSVQRSISAHRFSAAELNCEFSSDCVGCLYNEEVKPACELCL